MKETKIVLHFPKAKLDQPVVYRLVKDFNLEFNILKAEVIPNEQGVLVLGLKGTEDDLKKAITFLKKEGVGVQPLSQDVSMDRNKCVDCTACIPLCPTDALIREEGTGEVKLIKDKCIACGICVTACPYGAMKIIF